MSARSQNATNYIRSLELQRDNLVRAVTSLTTVVTRLSAELERVPEARTPSHVALGEAWEDGYIAGTRRVSVGQFTPNPYYKE